MIQIYRPENTDFEMNGDMTLFPTVATVHPVLNGTWEIKLEHPIDKEGRWKYIQDNAVVKMPSFNGDQLFRIINKEKNEDSIQADLQPIFMDAKEDCFLMDIRPTDKTGQQALDIMTAPNKKYKASSNISKRMTAYYQTKNLIEAVAGDDENSFINRWGGEILFDNFKIFINERIGIDNGVEVLYGKNIAQDGISEEVDMRDVATRIIPKAYNGHMIATGDPWIDSPIIDKYPTIRYRVMEFEDVKMKEDAREGDIEDGITICNTQEELKAALKKKCEEQYQNGVDKPKVSISVDMVMLEGTDVYADVEMLEKVSLGDSVHCRHDKLDIISDARIIELEWDCIKERVDFAVIGDYQYNYIEQTASMMNRVESAIRPDGSVIGQQVQGIINGSKAQLKAQSDIAKKTKVRAVLFEDLDPDSPTHGAMCLGTMGFEIASKRTADGRDWDWRTFGTGQGFIADYIIAGIISDKNGKSYWNLDNGELVLSGILQQFSRTGMRSVDIKNNAVNIYSWKKNGDYIGSLGALGSEDGNLQAIGLYCDGDNQLVIGYVEEYNENGEPKKNHTLIHITPKSKEGERIFLREIPQINNTMSGKIEFSDGTYLTFKNGFLIGGNTKEGEFGWDGQ